MVSLDMYQITNYSNYSKEHIICLIFKRFKFFMNIKMWLYKARFYSIPKSDYWKCQSFRSTGLEGGKLFIQTDLFSIMITNFQVLDNWKAFVHFMFQKFSISRMQCISIGNTSHSFNSCKDKVLFQKYTQKCN